jgi:hypothetical protein
MFWDKSLLKILGAINTDMSTKGKVIKGVLG